MKTVLKILAISIVALFIFIGYPYAKILLDVHTLETKNVAYSLEYYEKEADSEFELVTELAGYKSGNKISATTKDRKMNAFFCNIDEKKTLINVGYISSLLFHNTGSTTWITQQIQNYLQDMYISSEQLQTLFKDNTDIKLENSTFRNALLHINQNTSIKLKKVKTLDIFEIKSNYVFQILCENLSTECYICKENNQLLFFFKDDTSLKKVCLIFDTIDEVDIQIPKETISDNILDILRIGIATIQSK